MRLVAVTCALLLISVVVLTAQTPPQHYVSVEYLIDGKKSACKSFSVELRYEGQSFRPDVRGQRFEVPEVFNKPSSEWKDNDSVDLSLSCGGHAYAFSAHPGFFHVEQWTLGTAHPVYAIREYGYTHAFDRGAILDYLIFETEPGRLTLTVERDPPPGAIAELQGEQVQASEGRSRDIAYELAVYNYDYPANRLYLLNVLNRCLMRPKDSPEDDECDGDLLKFLTNLYWRGDDELLSPLLDIASDRRDVIGEIGRFYSDLLDGHSKNILKAMESLRTEKQSVICKLAYEDDMSMDSPKLARVQAMLRNEGSKVAKNCLRELGDKDH